MKVSCLLLCIKYIVKTYIWVKNFLICMTVPTNIDIYYKAIELFFKDNPNATTIPEIEELIEGGYWDKAKQELMRGEKVNYETEQVRYVQSLINELSRMGFRVIFDEEELNRIQQGIMELKQIEEKQKELEKPPDFEVEFKKRIREMYSRVPTKCPNCKIFMSKYIKDGKIIYVCKLCGHSETRQLK